MNQVNILGDLKGHYPMFYQTQVYLSFRKNRFFILIYIQFYYKFRLSNSAIIR